MRLRQTGQLVFFRAGLGSFVCRLMLLLLVLNGPFASLAQQPLSLKGALGIARTNNLYFKTLLYDTAAARSDVITAGLKTNPVFNNQYLQLMQSSYFAKDTRFYSGMNRQTWFQVTKVFQTAHKRELKIQLAKRSVILSEQNINEFSRNLLNDVANQWLDVWLLKQNLQLIREVRANIDTLIRVNEVRLRDQVITPIELVRTQVLADQYQLAESNATVNYRNGLLTLSQLLGTTDSLVIADQDSLDLEAFDQSLDSLLGYAGENRNDIALAKASVGVAESNLALQKALSKPNVEAGFVYNPQNSVQYAGTYVTVPLPLFDRNQGQIQKARVNQLRAESNLQAVKRTVSIEVQTAYQAFQTQKLNLQRSQEILRKSQRVVNTVRYAYLKGNTTVIDFLDAQRTFFDTQVSLNEAYLNLKKSYVNLLFSSGLINRINP